MKLSAVILTRNEEQNIQKCISGLDFVDEIIVVDDNSTDCTKKLAEKDKRVKCFHHELNDDFAAARNYGLKKATHEWVLFIDADEEVSEGLAREIKKKITNLDEDINAYYIKRRDVFWGKELSWGEIYAAAHKGFIRLVKKESGAWYGKVHEIYFVNSGAVADLNNHLVHRPHSDLKSFLDTVNQYSTIRAKELFTNNKKTNVFEIVLLPFFKFLYTYIFCLGVLDGLKGFVYCFMMSFHSFLVRAKLYMMYEKNS